MVLMDILIMEVTVLDTPDTDTELTLSERDLLRLVLLSITLLPYHFPINQSINFFQQPAKRQILAAAYPATVGYAAAYPAYGYGYAAAAYPSYGYVYGK